MLFKSVYIRALSFCGIVALVCCGETSRGISTDVEEDGSASEQMTHDQLRQVYLELDENGDSTVSRQELVDFSEKYQQDVVLAGIHAESLLQAKDTSKDGAVTLLEHLSHLEWVIL